MSKLEVYMFKLILMNDVLRVQLEGGFHDTGASHLEAVFAGMGNIAPCKIVSTQGCL